MGKLPAELLQGVMADSAQQIDIATSLAERLSLPVLHTTQANSGYVVAVTEHHVEIRSISEPPIHGPVYVDFVNGKAAHRRQFGGGRGQPLARAIGIKTGQRPTVIDATAGFGRDAFVLASLGCNVVMIEQSPVVGALLEDGLRRAQQNDITCEIAARLSLLPGNSVERLGSLAGEIKADAVYLDPMYPPRGKSALIKKEMQVLQAMVGHASDESGLLESARRSAGKRVVVKRPSSAGFLGNEQPHSCIKSPNTRYDIYLPSR